MTEGNPEPLSQARQRRYTALQRKHARRKTGLCVAEGRRVVSDLLDAGAALESVIVAEAGDPLVAAGRARGVPVYRAEARQWALLSGTETPQGVLAVLPLPRVGLDAVLSGSGPVLVLDGIRDPGNLGALARTAAALGAGLVLGPGTVDHGNPKALRASAGALLLAPPAVCEDAGELLAALAGSGRRVLAAVPRGGDTPWRFAGDPEGVCLVLGGEAGGPAPAVLQAATARVSIPMADAGTGDDAVGQGRARIDSLNVAAAGAILLYELARRRP